MNPADDPSVDWSSGTSAGSELEQLRVWSALPLRRKLDALEEMCDHARRTLEQRKKRGLPYIDPFTDRLIPGRPVTGRESTARVAEEPPERPAAEG
jgi:hypothetical protein